jgi:hypothetical protein
VVAPNSLPTRRSAPRPKRFAAPRERFVLDAGLVAFGAVVSLLRTTLAKGSLPEDVSGDRDRS